MNARLLAAALLLSCSTGCLVSRTIGQVTESGDRNLTLMQTNDTRVYIPFFITTSIKQFWACHDEGDVMSCYKACDSRTTDLACPPLATVQGQITQPANSFSK